MSSISDSLSSKAYGRLSRGEWGISERRRFLSFRLVSPPPPLLLLPSSWRAHAFFFSVCVCVGGCLTFGVLLAVCTDGNFFPLRYLSMCVCACVGSPPALPFLNSLACFFSFVLLIYCRFSSALPATNNARVCVPWAVFVSHSYPVHTTHSTPTPCLPPPPLFPPLYKRSLSPLLRLRCFHHHHHPGRQWKSLPIKQ